MTVTRRQFLQLGGLSAAATAGLTLPHVGGVLAKSASTLPAELMPRPYRATLGLPPVLDPVATGVDDLGPYASYVLSEQPGTAQILDGLTTPVWGYRGLLSGPTIHMEAGTRAIVKVRNRMPEVHPLFGHRFVTSTHLHGNASLPQYDGYASDLTGPGYTKVYQWPAKYQPARTLWYHDHASHVTAQNVYGGLAGQYHVHDDADRALLPQRPFDVPLTVSDAMFAADGSLGYDDRDHSGLWGDVVLVNGRPWPVMRVQRRVYRFRILNASISRSYRFTLLPEAPVHVVATDGGLMPRSQQVTQWRHASAERYEVLVDFSQFAAGQRVELRNLSNANNRDFDDTDKVMAFDVTDEPVDTADPTWNRVPDTLVSSHAMSVTVDQAVRRRRMELKKSDLTNEWSINERTWRHVVDSGFTEVFANPDLGSIELWTIENGSGGWFHPIHIHLVDFQVVSRNGQPPFPWELGPKDTVYVGEDETVEVLMRFGPHRGKYMVHCHNLPHEDHDMMIQYSVGLVAGEHDYNDPINADPPTWDVDGDVEVPPATAAPEPYEPLMVVRTDPVDGATGVWVGKTVSVFFAEAVEGHGGSSVTLTRVSDGRQVEFTRSLNSDQDRLRVDPAENLEPGMEYRVALAGGPSGIRTLDGLPLQAMSIAFTTAPGALTVVGSDPADGATDFAPGGFMTVDFSEPVTGTLGGNVVLMRLADSVSVPYTRHFDSATSRLTLNPYGNSAEMLQAGDYELVLKGGASGIRNAAGVPIADTTISFAVPAVAAPSVVSSDPADAATGVRPGTFLRVDFSETVTGTAGSNVVLTRVADGAEIPYTRYFDTTANRLTVNPYGGAEDVLQAGDYTLTLRGGPWGIRSLSGVPIEETTLSFTVEGVTAPTVVASDPSDGGTHAPGAHLRVDFSETVTGTAGSNVVLTRVADGVEVPYTRYFDTTANRLTVNPYGAGPDVLPAGEYALTLKGGKWGIRNLSGVPITETTISFTMTG